MTKQQNRLSRSDSLAPRGTSGARARERGFLLRTRPAYLIQKATPLPVPSPPFGGGEGAERSRACSRWRSRVAHLALISALLTLLTTTSALAQPAPRLNSLLPEWIQRGTTLQITFSGENLGSVTGFVFNGAPGLTASNLPAPAAPKPTVTIESESGGISRVEPRAKDEKRLVANVTASDEAPLGIRELRVLSPTGVSNPVLLNVGHLPEVAEKEPNNSLEQAQVVALPAVISGVIGASAQVDYYRFKGAKGQELIFDVEAARRGSALDSSLAILNPAGKELARNEDYNGLDSLVVFTVPEDGDYILQLRDFRYQGGGNYTYRLSAGALPYVQSIFPLGGQRGKQVEVALQGHNLAGTSKMTLALAPQARLGRQDIRAHTPNGYSNLRGFEVSSLPDFTEAEPNNTTGQVNVVSIPVAINGRIAPEKDIDRFKFKSDKDQKIICEVLAGRFGSKLDSLLTLTDAAGNVLVQNDDSAQADARIEFDARKDADYILSLRDLTDRGGDDFTYRLSIRPPAAAAEAGFEVKFLPDTLRLNRGSRSRVRCEVNPLAGFSGPVRLSFDDLPPGVYSEPLVLSAGAAASGLMLIEASKDAPLGNFPLKLTGSAQSGGKTIVRTAEPLSGDRPVREAFLTVLDTAPFTLELLSLNADVEQEQSVKLEVVAQRRDGFQGEIKLSPEGFSAGREPVTKSFDVQEATLKGGDTVGTISLKAKLDSEVGTRTVIVRGEAQVEGQTVVEYSPPLPVTLRQLPFVISSTLTRLSVTALPTNSASAASETATIIKVERRAGFAGEVTLTLEGLPAGIRTTLEPIAANAGETTLKLVATDKAPPGTNSFAVLGSVVHNDRTYRQRTGAIALVISAPEATEPAPKPVAQATQPPPAGAAK